MFYFDYDYFVIFDGMVESGVFRYDGVVVLKHVLEVMV